MRSKSPGPLEAAAVENGPTESEPLREPPTGERPRYEPPRIGKKRSVPRATLFTGGGPDSGGLVG